MDTQSETLRQINMQKKSPLTVSDDQLSVGGKWENVEFSFPPIFVKPFLFPLPFQ